MYLPHYPAKAGLIECVTEQLFYMLQVFLEHRLEADTLQLNPSRVRRGFDHAMCCESLHTSLDGLEANSEGGADVAVSGLRSVLANMLDDEEEDFKLGTCGLFHGAPIVVTLP